MIKILNTILNIFKMIMLLVCFVLTFYIIMNMYNRLDKNLVTGIYNFLPFILLFILFSINIIFRQKIVNECTFYNVTCCLVFIMLLFTIYRTIADNNMIMKLRLGYDINFNYFSDMIAPMRLMLYGLSISNILLMLTNLQVFNPKKKEKEKCV